MRLAAALIGAAAFLGVSVANAALTSSEKGQVKDFVAGARAENADKVRSLVARTDLSFEESSAVLSEAVAAVPFTDQRGIFLKELAFGGASAASRPVLVQAEVKALIARADAVYQRYVGGLDHEPRAVQELVAIYGWLDGTIANAGKPTSASHDGSTGIPSATYAECAKLFGEHLDRQARWLKGDGAIPESVGRLRAQAQVALVDLLPDGVTRRVDAADKLALKGARRAMLTDWGVLFADVGKIDDAKVERVRQHLQRLPAARTDLSLVYVGADRGGPLRARGLVTYTAVSAVRYPFLPAPAPGTYDAATSAIVHDLAVVAAKRALEQRPELRAQIERDAAAADKDRALGRPLAPSVEHVLGAAMHALLTDGEQATSLSVTRFLDRRPQTAALLSDALGALAAFAPNEKDEKDAPGPVKKIDLVGKTGAWVPATVRLAPNGSAIGFTLGGHGWSIDRASTSYDVLGMRRDGQMVKAGD